MKVVLIAFISWLIGLSAILITSFLLYETPGMQDAIGFGGLLLVSTIVLMVIYILLLRKLRNKISGKSILIVYPLLLAVLVNSPVYFFLWIQSGQKFGTGEAFLFFIGFIIVALVFGFGYGVIQLKKSS